MKDFFKFTLATIVGILVTGAVIVGVGIISLIGIWATSETETVVKNNSIYVLEFKGVVSERSQENPFGQLFGDNTTVNGLDDIIESIKKAKENENIKGIYLDAGGFACSTASLQEIRRALSDFKESGKFILAYGDNYTQST